MNPTLKQLRHWYKMIERNQVLRHDKNLDKGR